MFNKFKGAFGRFKKDRPGERFLHLNEWWRQEHPGARGMLISLSLGIILIAGGFLLGFIPGLPGIVLAVLGFGLIGAQFPTVARMLDRFELWLRRQRDKWRRRHGKAAQASH